MKTSDVEKKVNSLIANEQYFELRNYCSQFPVAYKTEEGYTDNSSAASYDQLNSCTNMYMKCEDGYVKHPF